VLVPVLLSERECVRVREAGYSGEPWRWQQMGVRTAFPVEVKPIRTDIASRELFDEPMRDGVSVAGERRCRVVSLFRSYSSVFLLLLELASPYTTYPVFHLLYEVAMSFNQSTSQRTPH